MLLFDASSMQPEEIERAISSGARVHREAPDAGRSRRDRVGQLDAAHRPGLHGRSRDARGGARSLFGARGRGVRGRRGAHRRGDGGRRLRRGRVRVQHLQHRSQARGDRAAVGRPRADSAEEIHRLLQQRDDAARRRQSGPAPRRDRSGGEGERLDLPGRYPWAHGGRSRRRREPVERTRRNVDVLGTWCVAPVRQPGGQPGHARGARGGYRRQGVSRHERLRRRLHEGHRGYVRVLPDRVLEHEPRTRRTIPAHPRQAEQAGPQGRAQERLLRDPRLPPLRQGRSRAAAAGSADDRPVVDRPDGLDVDLVLPARRRSLLRSSVDCGARL